ncbi:uncharacterized protein [Arachis hypogaea]|uniref:uncharacterized protein n=1 Tax=Arachis hypogaea TaxID=3818 RepID=UPI003B21F1DE
MDFVLVQTGTGSEVAPPILGGGAIATKSRQQQRSPPRDATQTHERRPFGGTGDNHARIMQELRHRMQDLERRLAERERDQRSPERSPTRSRSRSRSRRTPSPQYESESTRERIRPRRRSRDPIIYARHERRRALNRGNEEAHRENNESRRTARGPVIIGATPFHRSVLEVRLPKHFDKPTDMKYDGTQDPLEHLTAFEARMNLEGVGDEVRCRAFPVTLAGPAIRWFNNLPQGSVTQFTDISRAFLAQFTTRIVKAKHPINLLGVTQRPGEPTRKYLDRFNDECLEIDGLTDSVASLCLTNGLSNEDFRKHLTTKPVWTMQEIQCVAKEYINDEEVSRVVAANKRQPTYNQSRHFEARERPKEHAKDGGPSKPSKPFPRVGKFTNYTPIAASITEVYQQIAEKGILSKPRPLKDRTGENKNLYCEYHKGYGHKTQDCFDLKDALEQAIRDGKLADFSHLIREPRRRNRDNDNEDRSRPTRRRQEPEGDDHGLTVVNVVTARNTAPRSKSAQKKDAKVLAVSTPPVRGLKGLPPISFGPEDQWFDEVPESPPMVITARVGTGLVKRILTVEVYVDDILAKTARPDDLMSDLNDVFSSLRQHGMRLNPLKCAFAMEAGKFLGFMITQRGVEANPEKCQAILQMKSPGCIKDVQRLAGRLTALSRFLGASAARAIPFFNLMRKGMAFEWTPACEEAFNHFKQILAAPPVLGKPKAGEPLYLYLSVTEEALAAVLVTEEARTQQPVYFVSRALQGPELRYSKLERLALALLVSSRRLRQYFQSHRIVVRTDQAIRQILQKPDLAGRMMTWAIELSQYDLQYEPRHAIKAQAMVDFLVEEVVIQHVPREKNTRADLLSKLASTKPGSGNRSLIQGMVKEPTVALHLTESSPSWLDPITNFLELGKLPEDEKAAKALRREAARKFMEFLSGLGVKQKFSSVEHPQTNGQVEAANKVILLGLKKRLDSKKGNWADELPSVLWSYRTTEQSATGETPFRLTYGVDAVIPVEISEPSPRLLLAGMSEAVEKDLIEETREMAHLTETALKQRIALRYNAKVLKRDFEEGDLVLRRNDIGVPTPGEGKLAVNWEGPYRVREVLGKGAYKLEKLDGKEIPRTWNANDLKRFYS